MSANQVSEAAETLLVPRVDDFHLHLRQGRLMELVTPLLERGAGVRTAYVMPNLKPPVTTAEGAVAYRTQLQQLAPSVHFLMTLYLVPELTPAEIYAAAKAGVVGVKSYPKGVTTNSEGGIEDYTLYYHIFRAMEEVGMVLNLHGEVPSDPESDVCVLNAEERFLQHLVRLHADFPRLRIVLEHATTAKAVETVRSLGPTVACTITIHHLLLVVDDWAGQCHHFCKPVAKFPRDREALRQVVAEGHPRFFLGTDSAPHPRHAKEGATAAAGVFTGNLVLPYLAAALDAFGALGRMEDFACTFGRAFYGLPPVGPEAATRITLQRQPFRVPDALPYVDETGRAVEVVPFLAGKTLPFTLVE